MSNDINARASLRLKATASEVWEALTNPSIVKKYFFGTTVKSDWKLGAPVSFTGQWEGRAYEDKGVILEIIPEKYLLYSYWSSISGKEDLPENYMDIAYELIDADEFTTLTIIQFKCPSEEAKQHSENNWKMVLDRLKEILEKA